ncbi:MAG: ATP-binding protein [Tropicimonas sp.]|uniref:HAMP domain-containing sensor histidine kinase n=1 Tax=Tropicimonas sp. TaxID=2067044 RepID=UPI003A87DBD4
MRRPAGWISDFMGQMFYRTSMRLSLIFFVASLAVGLTTVFMIRSVLPEHPRNQLSQRLAQYAVDRLGPKPGMLEVEALAQALDATLVVLDDSRILRSQNASLTREQIEAAVAAAPNLPAFETTFGGKNYFVLRGDDITYTLGDFVTGMSVTAQAKLAGGLAVILLTLFLAFIAVRRIVAPLAPLADAVRSIGEGELDHRVAVVGSGEIRTLEHQVNEMANALGRAERVKREFLVAIGHEFSSPIARLMFQAEQVENDALRHRITGNLMRINTLFRTLVSVEAFADATDSPDDPPLHFPDELAEIAEIAGEDHIVLDMPEQRILIHTCRMRLELLLNNFISNALRYAPGSPIEVSARHGNDTLTLTVADHGPGVAEDLLSDLGEPFLRADKSRTFNAEGGLGLGLYLCSRLVARGQGRMRLSNREGGGLEVRVDLPCVAEAFHV